MKNNLSIAFDIDKMRPACVLLQVAMGASISLEKLMKYFPDVDVWLPAPTPSMRVYKTTEDELLRLSRKIAGLETLFVDEEENDHG